MIDALSITQSLGGRWHGGYGSAHCPAHYPDKNPSLSISDGDKALLLHCHTGCEFSAIVEALKFRGLWPGEGDYAEPDFEEAERRRKERLAKQQRKIDRAAKLWRECLPIAGTIAETYLRSRGITTPLPDTLRYHRGLRHAETGLLIPAMVGIAQGVNGDIRAIHRTYLKHDGSGKAPVSNAKMALGPINRCAIRLAPVGEELAIAEGIETALSFQQKTGIPTWSAISAGGMKSIKLPTTTKSVVIAADTGDVGEGAARALADRLFAEGREVKIVHPPEGCSDFNDAICIGVPDVDKKISSVVEKAEIVTWPDPDLAVINGSKQAAPEFPLELFGAWGPVIARAAENKSSPPDYVAAALLTALSALIGNARRVSPWGDWAEPAMIWTALVGIPSSGKSPAMDAVLAPVGTIQEEMGINFPELRAKYESDKEYAKEKRAQWTLEVKEAATQNVPPPIIPASALEPDQLIEPRIIVMDATVEALAQLLAAHPRGVMYVRDELAGWLASFDRYSGGGDRPFWIEAFGGRPYTVDRVKSDGIPLKIPHLSIAVTGGIQPDRLATLLMKGDDDGLASRFLLVWPDPIPPQRPHGHIDTSQILIALRRISAIEPDFDEHGDKKPKVIRLSDPAADLFNRWRRANAIEQQAANGLYQSYLGKMPGMVLRLALSLEHLHWSSSPPGTAEPQSVTEGTIGQAADLVDEYFNPMARRAYGDAMLPEDDRNAITFAKAIISKKQDVINLSNVRSKWHLPGLKDATKVKKAADILTEADWLRPQPAREGDNPGRKRVDYAVNPKLFSEDQHG